MLCIFNQMLCTAAVGLYIFCYNCLICVGLCKGLGSADEVRLVERMFLTEGYNPLIRPVRNLTETVKVKFGMAMIQLINVVSKLQI